MQAGRHWKGQRYSGSKDPADHPHSSVRTAWMRRKRWALAACLGLVLLLLAPVVVVRIVHIVLDVIDVSPLPTLLNASPERLTFHHFS